METSTPIPLSRKSSASAIDSVLLAGWIFLYAALLVGFRLLSWTEQRPMKKES